MQPTRQIKIGGRSPFSKTVTVGGGAPISVQSMTNTKTSDIPATIEQIRRLQTAGCDIVRIAVPDIESAAAIEKIKENIEIPLVADIHFDHKLALASMEHGADAIRINPGNIGDENKIRQVVTMAKSKEIPIRIGVNGGSLECDILERQDITLPEKLVMSATRHIEILEKLDFHSIAVSLKASNVTDTIAANRIMAEKFDYPFHLGVTEAGTPRFGLVKSAIGIGALLADGIGDTIRVSLTADPVEEIYAARLILQSLGLSPRRFEVIACPTCGRCNIDIISIANIVEDALLTRESKTPPIKSIKVAIMGCVVNGPGEARDADIGIAGGDGFAALFKNGEVVGKIPADQIVETLLNEVEKIV
ncbi:MAG: flavodoxin-dependent (E)-4-hydroxy-3-methylbut-2-enyl-diphosphate synthase [Oscillospiraceae bacterium]|nr:flavodoxin-dependent (E)-4-hydroxy-3-methylbut-2-enyl-diphosphate synthase [Oscillospiraceae bacterium]